MRIEMNLNPDVTIRALHGQMKNSMAQRREEHQKYQEHCDRVDAQLRGEFYKGGN